MDKSIYKQTNKSINQSIGLETSKAPEETKLYIRWEQIQQLYDCFPRNFSCI